MARCLIIGCGCRGRLLARELRAQGHAVRGTSRGEEGVAAMHAAGVDAVRADPDVVATLVPAFEHVTVVCILLASATGTPDQLRALHAMRLEMLLTKLVDTTARGVAYEARGSVEPELLRQGAARVRGYAERSLAGYALIEADPTVTEVWLRAAAGAVGALL
jgi:saccharopine dehydrogenase-like NADP-dependent oxidoreductase